MPPKARDRQKRNRHVRSIGLLDEQTLGVREFAAAHSAHLRALARWVGLNETRSPRCQKAQGENPRSEARAFMPRHLRRRATSHMRRRGRISKKNAVGDCKKEESKPERQGQGGSVQRKSVRLLNHRWHAKRMRMDLRWGYLLGIHRRDQVDRIHIDIFSRRCNRKLQKLRSYSFLCRVGGLHLGLYATHVQFMTRLTGDASS